MTLGIAKPKNLRMDEEQRNALDEMKLDRMGPEELLKAAQILREMVRRMAEATDVDLIYTILHERAVLPVPAVDQDLLKSAIVRALMVLEDATPDVRTTNIPVDSGGATITAQSGGAVSLLEQFDITIRWSAGVFRFLIEFKPAQRPEQAE